MFTNLSVSFYKLTLNDNFISHTESRNVFLGYKRKVFTYFMSKMERSVQEMLYFSRCD